MAQSTPLELVHSNGYYVYRVDNEVWITSTGTQWAATANFVLGLLLLIVVINGIIQLFSRPVFGSVLLVIGLVLALILLGVHQYTKKILAQAPKQNTILAIIDTSQKQLLDGSRKILAPLKYVTLERAWQATSSARALTLVWPGGKLVIARGNPFGGSVEPIEKAVQAALKN